MSERAPSRVLSVRLPADDYEALRSLGGITGRSMNEVVVRAIRSYLLGQEGAAVAAMIEETRARFNTVLDRVRENEAAARKREEGRRPRGSSA